MLKDINTYISMFEEEWIPMTKEEIENLLSNVDSIGNLFYKKYISKLENKFHNYEKNSNNIL